MTELKKEQEKSEFQEKENWVAEELKVQTQAVEAVKEKQQESMSALKVSIASLEDLNKKQTDQIEAL